jgi:heme/copper-type cytochrome/quinol oxidase subunit 3
VPRRTAPPLQVLTDPRPPALLPNAVFGMLLFVLVELMLFAGMISAFLISSSAAVLGWPPPGQPRLPVEETALNTLALLGSGVALFLAGRAYRKERRSARAPLLVAIALGAFFVCFQGVEWVALIREGLTLRSSTHGGFFYLIVGTHAAHAVAALGGLGYAFLRLRRRLLNHSTLAAASVFWYFVVGVWPLLYAVVYL